MQLSSNDVSEFQRYKQPFSSNLIRIIFELEISIFNKANDYGSIEIENNETQGFNDFSPEQKNENCELVEYKLQEIKKRKNTPNILDNQNKLDSLEDNQQNICSLW